MDAGLARVVPATALLRMNGVGADSAEDLEDRRQSGVGLRQAVAALVRAAGTATSALRALAPAEVALVTAAGMAIVAAQVRAPAEAALVRVAATATTAERALAPVEACLETVAATAIAVAHKVEMARLVAGVRRAPAVAGTVRDAVLRGVGLATAGVWRAGAVDPVAVVADLVPARVLAAGAVLRVKDAGDRRVTGPRARVRVVRGVTRPRRLSVRAGTTLLFRRESPGLSSTVR